jgi:hypothetical protein
MTTTRWLLLLTAALIPSAASAQVPPFSANLVTTMNQRQSEQRRQYLEKLQKQGIKPPAAAAVAMTGKLHASGLKVRVDMEANGLKSTMLSDISPGGKSYMIWPAQRTYVELKHDAKDARPRDQSQDLARFLKSGGDLCQSLAAQKQRVTCRKLGSKQVGSRTCDEYETTSDRGRTEKLCLDRKLHFPLRIETESTVTEMKNVVEARQPGNLFSLPAGYTKRETGSMGRSTPGP